MKKNVKSIFGTLTGIQFHFKEANVKSTSRVNCWKTWVWENTNTGIETEVESLNCVVSTAEVMTTR